MGQNVYDGNTSFRGGQNAGLTPDKIRPDQFAAGVNVTTKNANLGPRSGLQHISVEVTTDGGVTLPDGSVVSYKTIFKTGKFQGGGAYVTDSDKHIIAVISGIIFRIDPSSGTATVLTVEKQSSVNTLSSELIEPNSQRLDQYARRINWTQAGRFFVLFDYPDVPVIIDGGVARRANPNAPDYEVFASVLGTFNQSRLFISSAVNEFTGGDPVGNPLTPNAPISFEEVLAPSAPFLGQVFSLGSTNKNNPITAMGFLQAVDNITGIGPLFVATKSAVYAYHTDLARTEWERTKFGSLILANSGIAGPRSFVNVNSDILFMSGDGRIRSFSVAQSDQQKWAHTPMDKEVENWIKFIDDDLIGLTVAGYFDNRIFFTVNPYRVPARDLDGYPVTDYAFKGMVVLELDNVSGFMQEATPSWAGLWTGVHPMEMIDLDGKMFIFSKDPSASNVLYQMMPDAHHDVWENKPKQITSRVYTREYDFREQQASYNLKEENSVTLSLLNTEGNVCLEVSRKPESGTHYELWRKWKHTSPIEQCRVDSKHLAELLPHSFREINLGSPIGVQNHCNPVTKDDFRYFNRIQFRVTISAKNWSLESFRVKAEIAADDNLITPDCSTEEEAVKVEKICSEVSDWDLYRLPFDIAPQFGCEEETCP